MEFCNAAWCAVYKTKFEITESQLKNCHKVLSQAPPALIRILHAYRCCNTQYLNMAHLSRIHILLNLSWVELRAAILPVHTIIGRDKAALGNLLIRSTLAPDLLGQYHLDSVLWDLASGSLRLIKQICMAEVDINFQ
jgi:hypothetical protein